MNKLSPERIAVVQIGKLGDMILTTPLFRKLKSIFPNAQLSILASQNNSIIAENDQYVDQVYTYTKKPLKDLKLFLSDLNKSSIWIDTKPEKSDTSGLFLKIFRPTLSLGYNHNDNQFDVDLTQLKSSEHAVDINLAPVNYFGKDVTEDDRRPELLVKEFVERDQPGKFRNDKSAVLLVNVSAGKIGRQIEADTWVEVITGIKNEIELNVITICHPDDKAIVEEIYKITGAMHYETGSILEAAAVINISDYVITPDTSIVHICSALNKPVTAIYPNVDWNFRRFAPLSNYSESVISDSPEIVKTIKPQKIVNAFMRLYSNVTSGNAESRTRVRKEDH